VRILQTSRPKVAVKESVLIFIPSEPRVMGRETEKDLDQMTYISHADSDEILLLQRQKMESLLPGNGYKVSVRTLQRRVSRCEVSRGCCPIKNWEPNVNEDV
jgi:hypothetical protein